MAAQAVLVMASRILLCPASFYPDPVRAIAEGKQAKRGKRG